jgi:aldehyde:ferredoxin oxidoreductase
MALARKIAIIDLGRRTIDTFPVSADCRSRFLGGGGLAAYLFCRYSPTDHPLHGAEDVCVVSAGLLAGTLSAPLGYAIVTAKSASTGLMARACLPGPFSSEMRQAGFDHLVLKGRSTDPAYLFIHDGNIELREAADIPDKDPIQSKTMLREATAGRETRMLCIHNAGSERFYLTDGSSDVDFEADGDSIGTVLATKNIKALACRGTMDIEVKDPEAVIAFERNGLTHTVSAESASSDVEATPISGPAGQIGSREIAETITRCLGLPFGTNNGVETAAFETASARIRLNTGMELNPGDLKNIAYRCIALERLYNIRAGIAGTGSPAAAEYQKNGWTRKAVMKKGRVFERLEIGDLWEQLKF